MGNNKVYRNRSEIFDLIGERSGYKFSNSVFNDDEYTKTVVNVIQSASDEKISYNEDGFTLLHLAIQEGEPEFVKELLMRGLSVNICAENGGYPLDFAVSHSKGREHMTRIISMLLEAGADLDKKSKKYTPREMIKMFEDEELYCFLSKEEQEELVNKQENILFFDDNDNMLVKSKFEEEDYYNFVTTNNLTLDKIYIEFFKKYNGYITSKSIKCANGFEPNITSVLSFSEVKKVFAKTRLDKKLKDNYLPIACLDGENHFVYIRVKGKDKGKIFIYLSNVRYLNLIADNLSEFFLLLNIGM
jgi:hypothetical protein